MTPWPIYSGASSIVITKYPADNKWYVTGKGIFTRRGLTVVNHTPANSQFRAQVPEHEEHHVAQFAGIAPWKDMWDVNSEAPAYREWKKADVSEDYGCQF